MVISTAGWLGWICKAPEILQWRSLAAGLLLSSREYVIFATWHYGFWVNFSHEINIFFFLWTNEPRVCFIFRVVRQQQQNTSRRGATARARCGQAFAFPFPLTSCLLLSEWITAKTLVEGFPTGSPSVTEGSLQERRRGAFYRNV